MVWVLSVVLILLLMFVLIQAIKLNRTIKALQSTNVALNETRQVVSSQVKTIKELQTSLVKLSKKI